MFSAPLSAQVEIDNRIELNSPQNSERKVSVNALPLDSSTASSAGFIAENKAHFVTAALVGDTLKGNLAPAISSYFTGMSVQVISPSNSTGPLFISLNGLPAYPIRKHLNFPLDSADILTGQALQLVFDGSVFQLSSPLQQPCPAGYVAVNENYCIEINERATAIPGVQAITDCRTTGARLCNWMEWYYACQNGSLGVQNMTNNYEWTDDAGNENNLLRITGNGSCKTISNVNYLTQNYYYRCCFSR